MYVILTNVCVLFFSSKYTHVCKKTSQNIVNCLDRIAMLRASAYCVFAHLLLNGHGRDVLAEPLKLDPKKVKVLRPTTKR